jgi:putative glutamine amidotransferase
MALPRIGISASPRVLETSMGPLHAHAVTVGYVDGVRRAGGLPIVLPILSAADVPALLAGIDGLVMTGGGDVDPARYGQPRDPSTGESDAARDEFDVALVHAALDEGLPLLAVCRGAQVLNVALGGTLVQHLPDTTGHDHGVYDRHTERVHEVRVAADSRLAAVLRGTELQVNSLHHQSADRLGRGLLAVAWSPDGAIEAIEGAGDDGPLGIQWHPELLGTSSDAGALFSWVVERALARSAAAALR